MTQPEHIITNQEGQTELFELGTMIKRCKPFAFCNSHLKGEFPCIKFISIYPRNTKKFAFWTFWLETWYMNIICTVKCQLLTGDIIFMFHFKSVIHVQSSVFFSQHFLQGISLLRLMGVTKSIVLLLYTSMGVNSYPSLAVCYCLGPGVCHLPMLFKFAPAIQRHNVCMYTPCDWLVLFTG